MLNRFKITAYDAVLGKREELFTWTRSAQSGIARAQMDAINFGKHSTLSDYQAEPIDPPAFRPAGPGCWIMEF